MSASAAESSTPAPRAGSSYPYVDASERSSSLRIPGDGVVAILATACDEDAAAPQDGDDVIPRSAEDGVIAPSKALGDGEASPWEPPPVGPSR